MCVMRYVNICRKASGAARCERKIAARLMRRFIFFFFFYSGFETKIERVCEVGLFDGLENKWVAGMMRMMMNDFIG